MMFEYFLSRLQDRISKASGNSPFPISTVVKDIAPGDAPDGDEESDEDDDEEEETALEGISSSALRDLVTFAMLSPRSRYMTPSYLRGD